MKYPYIRFIIILAIAAAFLRYSAIEAQELPNGNMEFWHNSGSPPPFDWYEPDDWKSNNSVVEFIKAAVSRLGNAGNYSCKIETVNVFGNNVPGMLCLGDAPGDFSTYTLDIFKGGMRLEGDAPLYLYGKYYFSSTDDADMATALVILKKFNAVKDSADTVGVNIKLLPINSALEEFSVKIEANISVEKPDSIIVAFLSSNPAGIKAGGVLIIDDLYFDFTGSGVGDNNTRTKCKAVLFPNPARESLQFDLGNDGEEVYPVNVEIYNSCGVKVSSSNIINRNDSRINISGLSPGIYRINFNYKGVLVNSGTFLVNR